MVESIGERKMRARAGGERFWLSAGFWRGRDGEFFRGDGDGDARPANARRPERFKADALVGRAGRALSATVRRFHEWRDVHRYKSWASIDNRRSSVSTLKRLGDASIDVPPPGRLSDTCTGDAGRFWRF
ncbi:hypothetical protein [Burkholderia pseudomallei]|uniref:hypothetical protein n=1 Tax=Burkholderia pseudomallei TaxID=28450 RepID=UPI002800705C|nr:hypothetical protein [Burkholderia pseudomallei]